MLAQLRTWYVNYGFLVIGVLLVNVGFLNWYLSGRVGVEDAASATKIVDKLSGEEVVIDNCDEECVRQLIGESVASLSGATKEEAVASKVVSTGGTVSSLGEKQTKFVSLPGGSAVGNDWMRVGEVKWLDTSLYGSLVSATWQGWVELPGGSGIVEMRLYDATNGRAVDGSQVVVTNVERTSFYSPNISLWRGQNQYFAEVKNTGGGVVSLSGLQIKLIVR